MLTWLREGEVPTVPLDEGFIRYLSRTIMLQAHLNNGLILLYFLMPVRKVVKFVYITSTEVNKIPRAWSLFFQIMTWAWRVEY